MTIHFYLVYDRGGNIGKCYNNFMNLIPDGDYACLMDNDAMLTTYGAGEQLYRIAEKYPRCGLFVALANRIGCPWQRSGNWDSDNIIEHRAHGLKLQGMFYDKIRDVTHEKFPFSGFLMLISKRVWKKVGGFKEDGVLGVDNDMHLRTRKAGEKVYLMRGIFLYHFYRGGKMHDKSHFKNETRLQHSQ